jgi:hypothetical protein
MDWGDETLCSFGVKASKANVVDPGYLTCVAPKTDVVDRGMPFSISLNGQ